MNKQNIRTKTRKNTTDNKTAVESKPISYRLKCAKTANGLSHYVMYGDVDKKQALL